MPSPEAAMRTPHYPWFETASTDSNDDKPILAWEAKLNDKRELLSGEVAGIANDDSNAEHKNRPTKGRCNNDEDMIAREVRSTEESLEDILHKYLHHAQSGIQSAVYNVIERMMLDALRRDDIWDILDAHITKFFDTFASRQQAVKGVFELEYILGAYSNFCITQDGHHYEKKKYIVVFAT